MELFEKRNSTGRVTFCVDSFRVTDEIHRLMDDIKVLLYKYILKKDTVDAMKSYGVEIDKDTDIRDVDKLFGLLETVYNFYFEKFHTDENTTELQKPDDDKVEDIYVFIGKYLSDASEIVKAVQTAMRDICLNDKGFECYSQHYGIRVNKDKSFLGECEIYDKDDDETLYTFMGDYLFGINRITPRKLMVLYDIISKSNIDTAFKTFTIDLNEIRFLNKWLELADKGYKPQEIDAILRDRWVYDYNSDENNAKLADRLGMFNPNISVGELIRQLIKDR